MKTVIFLLLTCVSCLPSHSHQKPSDHLLLREKTKTTVFNDLQMINPFFLIAY